MAEAPKTEVYWCKKGEERQRFVDWTKISCRDDPESWRGLLTRGQARELLDQKKDWRKKIMPSETKINRIIVPSVKHSGGDVLTDHLLEAYPKGTIKAPDSGVVVHAHTLYTKINKLLDLAKGEGVVTIIPVRHPKVVASLWAASGDELNPDFFQMWDSLERFMALDNAVMIPMDDDDYVARAKTALDKLGIDVRTPDFLPNGTKALMSLRAHKVKWSEVPEQERVQDLVDDMEGFFAEVYGYDPEDEPDKKEKEKKRKSRKAKAPADTWKHTCPVTKEEVNVKDGEICDQCGAEG